MSLIEPPKSSQRRGGTWLLGGIFLFLVWTAPSQAEVRHMVLGQGGTPWLEVAQEVAALEDTTAAGSLQPRRYLPEENILHGGVGGLGQIVNLLGFTWTTRKSGQGTSGFKLNLTPRFWRIKSGIRGGNPLLIDGDPLGALTPFPAQWTFDLGVPMPVSRIVFYAPNAGYSVQGEEFANLFPRGYEVTGALEASDLLLLANETSYHPLEIEIAKTFNNQQRVVDLAMVPTMMRFLRFNFAMGVSGGFTETLSEIEAYADGYPTRTWLVTSLIDMGGSVNFGRLNWDLEPFREIDGEVQPDSLAKIQLSVQTRTGLDETPLVYHIITQIGREREVSEKEFKRALPPSSTGVVRPGLQGSVISDVDNWSFWSSPSRSSGEFVQSPDGRRFLQLQFTLESEDILSFGRLNSIDIEISELLATQVLGEVALLDDPKPLGDIARAEVGRDTVFTFDLRSIFANGQEGFDGVRIVAPSKPEFVGFEMGDPLVPVEPDSFRTAGQELVVYFPSNRVRPSDNRPVRILFRGAALSFSSHFTGNVLSTTGEVLPQSIDPGDANPEVTTNDILVQSEISRLDVLPSLDLIPPVLTPNGDGRNDEMVVSFSLLGVREVPVDIGIYDLSGQLVRSLLRERLDQEIYDDDIKWDGLLDDGSRAMPGLYLCRVLVEANTGPVVKLRSIAVAY